MSTSKVSVSCHVYIMAVCGYGKTLMSMTPHCALSPPVLQLLQHRSQLWNYQCNLTGFCTVSHTSSQALILPHNLSNVHTTSQHLCNLCRLLHDLLQLLHYSLLSYQWHVPPNILGGPCMASTIFFLILST